MTPKQSNGAPAVTQMQTDRSSLSALVSNCDSELLGHWRIDVERQHIEFTGMLSALARTKPFEAIPLVQALIWLGNNEAADFNSWLLDHGETELRWPAPEWAQEHGIQTLRMVRATPTDKDGQQQPFVHGEVKCETSTSQAATHQQSPMGALQQLTPQILQTLPDPVFIFELGRGWIFVNPMAEELLTKPPVLSDGCVELSMPKGFKRMMEHMHERVVGSGRAFRIEFYAKHRTLGLRWWSGLWSPLNDADGNLKAIFVLHRDVSEQTELQGTLIRDRKKLQVLASTDPLTRLSNRRAFLDSLASLATLDNAKAKPVAILLFDVDHFKSVNDSHGHAVGDDVLKTIAKISRHELRAHDILARWGGEEFIICLPQTDRDEALAIAERLRAAIANAPIKCDGKELFVTASFGVAIEPGLSLAKDVDREAMINKADEALYRAKREGRNRVCLASVDEAMGCN